jgi:Family of unknown function (DUF6459)
MRTPPPELPGHAPELPAWPTLPPFPRQRGRRRPLPDAVAVRRLPLPASAPPYDDQSRAPRPRSADTGRPQTQAKRDQQPPPPPSARDLHAGADRPAAPGSGEWPGQFAQALAEALAGSRPARQVTPWTTEQARRRISQLGPVLKADQRPRVRRVLTSVPDTDIVEMTVIIGVGPRIRAMAVRLERAGPGRAHPGRERQWLCTAIEAA